MNQILNQWTKKYLISFKKVVNDLKLNGQLLSSKCIIQRNFYAVKICAHTNIPIHIEREIVYKRQIIMEECTYVKRLSQLCTSNTKKKICFVVVYSFVTIEAWLYRTKDKNDYGNVFVWNTKYVWSLSMRKL